MEALYEAARALTILAVGGAFELSDEVLRRLREANSQADSQTPTSDAANLTPTDGATPTVGAVETEADRVRHAVLGLLLDGEALAYYGSLVTWEAARAATHGLAASLNPLLRFRAARRGQRQVQALADHGAELLTRWMNIGRAEEPRGRTAARAVAESFLDDILTHLANDPEMRELIEHQGLGLAGSVVDEVRERTISADTRVERVVRGLLRRSTSSTTPQTPAATPRPIAIQPAME
jgi:hypothetical protein